MVWFFKKNKDKKAEDQQPEKDVDQVEEDFQEAVEGADEKVEHREKIVESAPMQEAVIQDETIDHEPVITPEPEPEIEEDAEDEKPQGWLSRLTSGLSKSSSKITENITAVITKRKLDDDTLEELEEALIVGDLGPATAAKVTAALAKNRYGKDVTDLEVREALADELAGILRPVAKPLDIGAGHPHVISVSYTHLTLPTKA